MRRVPLNFAGQTRLVTPAAYCLCHRRRRRRYRGLPRGRCGGRRCRGLFRAGIKERGNGGNYADKGEFFHSFGCGLLPVLSSQVLISDVLNERFIRREPHARGIGTSLPKSLEL